MGLLTVEILALGLLTNRAFDLDPRNIPVPDYRNDVKLLMCNRRKPQKNIDDLINNYNSTLQKLTDKYAPLQCKTISLRPLVHKYITPGEKGAQAECESGCANDAGS